MIIAGRFSFNQGYEFVQEHYPQHLLEVENCIASLNKEEHKNKISKDKTKKGQQLYSPIALNNSFKQYLEPRGWNHHKETCEYKTDFYTQEYRDSNPEALNPGAFRDMDFVKDQLGVEVQFGKYSFMVYNVCAKMTIFKNLDIIKAGIEIVPIKALAEEMSSGVSYFEKFVWDLEMRGVADIDIPVVVIGIA